MFSRPLVVVAGVIVVACLAVPAVGGLHPRITAHLAGGPLVSDPLWISVSATTRTRLTFGAAYLSNRWDRPLVLESVRWRAKPDGLRLLGVLVAGEDRRVSIGESERFPDPRISRFSHPLAGYRLAPYKQDDAGTEIHIGVRATRPGRFTLRGLEIRYRIGRKQFLRYLDDILTVCAVTREPVPRCR